jgi:hypothetical protein
MAALSWATRPPGWRAPPWLGEEFDLAPEASRQRRPVDLPRRHRVLERESDVAVNGDLFRVHAPGVACLEG